MKCVGCGSVVSLEFLNTRIFSLNVLSFILYECVNATLVFGLVVVIVNILCMTIYAFPATLTNVCGEYFYDKSSLQCQ